MVQPSRLLESIERVLAAHDAAPDHVRADPVAAQRIAELRRQRDDLLSPEGAARDALKILAEWNREYAKRMIQYGPLLVERHEVAAALLAACAAYLDVPAGGD